MTKITELFPVSSAPAAPVKHNNARNSLCFRSMILREKDFYLASDVAFIFVNVHFAHGSICTVDLLGIKAGERQQDQEDQSWHDVFVAHYVICPLRGASRVAECVGYTLSIGSHHTCDENHHYEDSRG